MGGATKGVNTLIGLEGIWYFLTETTALHTGTDMLSSQGHCRGGASRGSNAKEQVGGAA